MTRPARARRALLSVAALSTALAFPAALAVTPLAVDDAGIDYTDDEVDEAHLGFRMQDDALTLVLTEAETDGGLPALVFEVPERSDEEAALGNEVALDDVDGFTALERGLDVAGFDAVHEDADMRATVRAYRGALEALGFDAAFEDDLYGNSAIATFSRGDEAFRVVFKRSGADVGVHFTGV